jgi:hypothetical protein
VFETYIGIKKNTPSCHSERSEESSSSWYTGNWYGADLSNEEDSSLSLRMTALFKVLNTQGFKSIAMIAYA